MDLGLALVILVLVVGFLLYFSKLKGGGSVDGGPWPFYPRRPLSDPELILYRRLVLSLPSHIVLAQVSLGRFLGVKKGHNFGQWFNRINRMSADFLVCGQDGSVLAVIELDDASHSRADRVAADAKKNKALESAGLRMIRWQAKSLPDESLIRGAFADAQPADAADGSADGGVSAARQGHAGWQSRG